MPYFEVKGIGKVTNRKKTTRYKAKDELHARILAEKDVINIESVMLKVKSKKKQTH